MPNSQNTQLETPTTVTDAEVVDNEIEQNNQVGTNNIFNQQNNFHLVQNIDFEKLTVLYEKSPDIANRVMELYEKQQQHNIKSDDRVLTLEEKEQKVRHNEIPFQRKFAFRALNYSAILSIASLMAAGYFAYKGYPKLAGTSIAIVAGLVALNMLGARATKQNGKKTNK